MVAIGMALIGLSLARARPAAWRGLLFRTRWLLWVFVFCGARAADRQPARLDRRRGRAPAVDRLRADAHRRRPLARREGPEVLISLILFTLVYLLLFVLFLFLLDQKIKHGPLDDDLPADARHRADEGLMHSTSRPPGSCSSACCSPATPCSTASTSGSASLHLLSRRPTRSGASCSTPSARSGTATRSGWSPAAARCSRRFPNVYATVFSGFYLAVDPAAVRPDLPRRGHRVPQQAADAPVAADLGLGLLVAAASARAC